MHKGKLVFIYNHIEEIILVSMMGLMVLITFLQIIMRFVFNNSLSWSEEFGRLLFVWLTWLGISIGQRKGEHIKIAILSDKLPFKLAQILNIIADIFVIGVSLVTLYYGAYLTKMMLGTKYVALGISYSFGYACIPIGCCLMIIRSLYSMWISGKSYINGQPIITADLGGEI